MLQAARAQATRGRRCRRRRGRDARPARRREALLEGLEVIPRRAIEYKGRTLEEMDLDALLRAGRSSRWSTSSPIPTRRAAAIPSAISTSRSCSSAGIDVYTTLNIQHIESLNDVVAQITGIRVRETVPDSILDRADDIELDRPHAGGPDPAAEGRQGLRPASRRERAIRALLLAGQPDRACANSRCAARRSGSTSRC